MALTANDITAQNFRDFYQQIFPYLNKGNGGLSECPLGMVSFFDDTVAPDGWLVADGSVYDIVDYPDLANHYERVHGSKNYWGGNGTTTFGVPDWQGEFLRASGTNSHTNQGSGGEVGEHQDGTRQLQVGGNSSNNRLYVYMDEILSDGVLNADNQKNTIFDLSIEGSGNARVLNDFGSYTSRPTNTSLLLCIKAVPSGDLYKYSTNERRVGTWIDGKPLYQKTITGSFAIATQGSTCFYAYVEPLISDVNLVVKAEIVSTSSSQPICSPLHINNRGSQWVLRTMDSETFNTITVWYTKTTDA